jgi:hypothetical protein
MVSSDSTAGFADYGAALEDLLTTDGKRLWRRRTQEFDSTPTLSDAPSTADRLGRGAFAEALARRIRSMRAVDPDAPLLIHLHGPWGSGKSSILRLAEDKLDKVAEVDGAEPAPKLNTEPYVVVEFNAWQYQRIEPPWWSLIGAITRQVTTALLWPKPWPGAGKYAQRVCRALRLRAARLAFRVISLRAVVVLASMTAALLGLLFLSSAVSGSTATNSGFDLQFFGGLFGVIASVFAGATALFGIFFASPEEAAARFVGSRADPLLRLEAHVRKMIRRVRQPVAVFVDDLDRCTPAFIVQFLEGVQTLFRAAPVTFVVAADREWLYQSFETIYAEFRPIVPNPARPLGHLFLEKTFQMSIAVPPISDDARRYYWRWLLRFDVESATEAQEEVSATEQAVAQSVTEREVLDKVAESGGASEAVRRAATRAAVVRLAAPDIELHVTRHLLEKFGPLLEANPRSMKRLVMAYGMNRATDLLMGRLTPADELALWTVFAMRWPRLAEWLEVHPEAVELFGATDLPGPPAGPPPALAPLFNDPEVRKVLAGGDIAPAISAHTLRLLSYSEASR